MVSARNVNARATNYGKTGALDMFTRVAWLGGAATQRDESPPTSGIHK